MVVSVDAVLDGESTLVWSLAVANNVAREAEFN